MALQSIVLRRINPFDAASISIGSFDGKGQFNIIKDSVTLEGDVRCMSDENRQLIEQEIQRLCDGLAKVYHCEIELDYQNDYPVLMNDPQLTQQVVKAIQNAEIQEVNEILDGGQQNPSGDFAYYSIERPSCFFYRLSLNYRHFLLSFDCCYFQKFFRLIVIIITICVYFV